MSPHCAKSLTPISRSARVAEIHRALGGRVSGPSPKKPVLWVRTAAGPDIGFGHLRRSIILSRLLSDSLAPAFLHDSQDRWTKKGASENGWEAIPLGGATAQRAGKLPEALLVDTREETGLTALIAFARRHGTPVISIHDLGLNPLPSDIIIDGSLLGEENTRTNCGPTYYFGTSYLVIDPVFAGLHRRRRQMRRRIQRVVVSLGGGNTGRFCRKVLHGLQLWGREIEVLGLPGFSDWGQEHVSESDWSPVHFRWIEPPEPVAAMMSADIAITAGGLSIFEALCAGTPVLALSHDHLQHLTVAKLADGGACIDLGLGGQLDPTSLPDILEKIDSDIGIRQELSRLGRRVLDGRGAERVSRIIRQAIEGKSKLQC